MTHKLSHLTVAKGNFIVVFRPLAYVWFDVAGNHNFRLNGTEVFKIYVI